MNRDAFRAWLATAPAGARTVYHEGDLLTDREETGDDDASPGADALALRKTADAAMEAAEAGLVHLAQRRLGPGHFEYIAERR